MKSIASNSKATLRRTYVQNAKSLLNDAVFQQLSWWHRAKVHLTVWGVLPLEAATWLDNNDWRIGRVISRVKALPGEIELSLFREKPHHYRIADIEELRDYLKDFRFSMSKDAKVEYRKGRYWFSHPFHHAHLAFVATDPGRDSAYPEGCVAFYTDGGFTLFATLPYRFRQIDPFTILESMFPYLNTKKITITEEIDD